MKRIRTFRQLRTASFERRSVIGLLLKKPKPAAFVINMNAVLVDNLMTSGLYVYEKKKRVSAKN